MEEQSIRRQKSDEGKKVTVLANWSQIVGGQLPPRLVAPPAMDASLIPHKSIVVAVVESGDCVGRVYETREF